MKRDLDLIRQLLLRIEAQRTPLSNSGTEVLALSFSAPPLRMPDEDPAAIEYNIRQLVDGGFLLLSDLGQFAGWVNLVGLSWKGHDFLDSVRDETVWRKTKDGAVAAGGWTFGLLCDLAKAFAKKQIEDRTGLKL